MQAPERLRLATRGSRLARIQTQLVADALQQHYPGIEIETVVVTTTGDRDQRPFAAIGGKGLFTTEVERALLDGRADAAVHSAKDLTSEIAPDCAIVCIPERAAPHDIVIGGTGGTGEDRLASLPAGARVGTSSMRRRALLAELRGDVVAVEFRGNLDTRIEKVARGDVDAAIVAAAGLARLGAEVDVAPLDPLHWVPAPKQGALAVEVLSGRTDLERLFEPLNHLATWTETNLETAFARRLEGGCSVPLGCVAHQRGHQVVAVGFVGSPDGQRCVRALTGGPPEDADALGVELAERMLRSGGAEILAALDRARTPEVVEP
ncbi:MAG: hydroxymethylbilane synthase [Actinomycetota bacterium]|nr:hydroxymethylbilane synthase [Actinomycetota bacterium]